MLRLKIDGEISLTGYLVMLMRALGLSWSYLVMLMRALGLSWMAPLMT
jgi:hypothetical protein